MTFTKNEITGMYSTLSEMCGLAVYICEETKTYDSDTSRIAAAETVDYLICGFYRFYDLCAYQQKFTPDGLLLRLLKDFNDSSTYDDFQRDYLINTRICKISAIGYRACSLWKDSMN